MIQVLLPPRGFLSISGNVFERWSLIPWKKIIKSATAPAILEDSCSVLSDRLAIEPTTKGTAPRRPRKGVRPTDSVILLKSRLVCLEL